jgi:hypothetical protein
MLLNSGGVQKLIHAKLGGLQKLTLIHVIEGNCPKLITDGIFSNPLTEIILGGQQPIIEIMLGGQHPAKLIMLGGQTPTIEILLGGQHPI